MRLFFSAVNMMMASYMFLTENKDSESLNNSNGKDKIRFFMRCLSLYCPYWHDILNYK